MPIYTPADDFLKEVIDDFGVGDITIDGSIVTVKMEEGDEDLTLGEAKGDYTIEFEYGDTGSQSSVTFKDADGNEFYKTQGEAPFIPGYDILILVGLSGISTMAIIYVVMRKRR
ncbi:MAG: hypothetical protein ACOC44_14805 [Promethearchaeia archaeon]